MSTHEFPSARLDTGADLDRNGLERLSRGDCLALLGTQPVGRIVLSVQALPAIRPVYFALDGEYIVIRTSGRGALGAAADGAVVAFEADDFGRDPGGAWSVAVVGQAHVVIDPGCIRRLDKLRLQQWTPVKGGQYLRIGIDRISGRRIPNRTNPPTAV